ncbi:acyl-CoA desaturase [Halobacteriovorax sp.]|uniref:acyl-CoA desaturase n=1 Tax=Halobacteriovorax sp. TaxID=2020862 RepID=UPI003563DE48
MKFKNIDWVNTLFLILTPLTAIGLTALHIYRDGFMPSIFIAALVLACFCGASITIGYHRLFSHRTFEASAPVKLFLLIFGAAAFQNSLLKWGSDHRVHHKFCDTEKDPYNINRGFFWAHMGWVMFREPSKFADQFPMSKDLLRDKMVVWQHKYYLQIAVLAGLILPGVVGYFLGSTLGGFAVIGFARIVAVHHSTFFINSLCHVLGSKTYSDDHTAKDSPIMALFTFGEGYHNFHHTFQADYRNGVKWYHFDPSKWTIWSLSKIGMASKLKRVPAHTIRNARIKMQQKKFSESSSAELIGSQG